MVEKAVPEGSEVYELSPGDTLVIDIDGKRVRVVFFGAERRMVKLGIDAPRDIAVNRGERRRMLS